MDIHQLSVAYVVEHDRILVRLNTRTGDELRFWLTRRMLLNLYSPMIESVVRADANQAMLTSQDESTKKLLSEFRKTQSLEKADFKTPFKAQATAFPLGSEPVLATSVRLTPFSEGKLRLAFEERFEGSSKARSFEITLESSMLHGFMHVLDAAIKSANWGMAVGASAKLEAGNPDDTPGAIRPLYLN